MFFMVRVDVEKGAEEAKEMHNYLDNGDSQELELHESNRRDTYHENSNTLGVAILTN